MFQVLVLDLSTGAGNLLCNLTFDQVEPEQNNYYFLRCIIWIIMILCA